MIITSHCEQLFMLHNINRCPDNWEGPNCDIDVNECEEFEGTDLGCKNGATCQNTPGGYT